MKQIRHRGQWFWESFNPRDSQAGAHLAALRRGLNKAPGDVPEMWPHHRAVLPDFGWADAVPPPVLAAEHAALVTFAIHQQSQDRPMHDPEVPIGRALHRLKKNGKYSEAAVDARVNAMATATDTTELVEHLRHLVSQLRTIGQPLDYNRLVQDLSDWHHPERRAVVRRAWGRQYYLWSSTGDANRTPDPFTTA